MTCFGAGRSATRLYYLGVDNAVNVLARTANGWDADTLDLEAAPNSPLTCFGFNDTDPPRIFYRPGFTDHRDGLEGRAVDCSDAAWPTGP